MYVLVKFLFLDSRLAILGVGAGNCPFGFALAVFYCGAVTLSASFFPFGVLERKVLGNCIDSWSLPSFLFQFWW